MGIVSVSLPTDGSTADVADYNTPITTIVNAINGNLDSNNISGLSGAKITAATLPGTALDANVAGGWITGVPAPDTVAYNGNRSYSLTFNSTDLTGYLSPGIRLKTTRSAAAPTQCTSLNGSTQYYSKTSPAAMTFTDDFTVSVWVKLSSYTAAAIASRYNGTSGWVMDVLATGQVRLIGFNAGSANFSLVSSVQSLPLNKWVNISAQLDMSTFTITNTTSYVMIDGVNVAVTISRGGTNPTALVQAGNLEIGSENGGTSPFPGKIAQVAIFNAKVTQSTLIGYISQTFAGTETSLISAYSFNNTINDLNTNNANNLTANGSAVATNADSPYGGQGSGTISATLDYSIIQSSTFSTNTTLVVQVAEGCAIPTSGGVSAVSYSTTRSPYQFPTQTSKFQLESMLLSIVASSGTVAATTYNPAGYSLSVPIGNWNLEYDYQVGITTSSSTIDIYTSLSSSSTTFTVGSKLSSRFTLSVASGSSSNITTIHKSDSISAASATPYYALIRSLNNFTALQLRGDTSSGIGEVSIIRATNAYL